MRIKICIRWNSETRNCTDNLGNSSSFCFIRKNCFSVRYLILIFENNILGLWLWFAIVVVIFDLGFNWISTLPHKTTAHQVRPQRTIFSRKIYTTTYVWRSEINFQCLTRIKKFIVINSYSNWNLRPWIYWSGLSFYSAFFHCYFSWSPILLFRPCSKSR